MRRWTGAAVYRIEYHRRDDWTWTLVTDEVSPQDPGGHGVACRNGTYGYVDAPGNFNATETHSDNCNGVGRWVHYGIATSLPSPWTKEVADGRVTYTLLASGSYSMWRMAFPSYTRPDSRSDIAKYFALSSRPL